MSRGAVSRPAAPATWIWSTNRVLWRGDSGLRDGRDGIYFGDATAENLQVGLNLDLTGGYHDAGDHVKFGLPLASTLQPWPGVASVYRRLHRQQPVRGLAQHRPGTDYLLKAQESMTQEGPRISLHRSGMDRQTASAGTGTANHPRPALAVTADKPGTDVAAAGGALASASVLFRETGDPGYADTLEASESLFTFVVVIGRYSDSIQPFKAYGSWAVQR